MPFLSTVKEGWPFQRGETVARGFHHWPKVQNRNGTRDSLSPCVSLLSSCPPPGWKGISSRSPAALLWHHGCKDTSTHAGRIFINSFPQALLAAWLSGLVPTHSSGQFCSMKNVGDSITLEHTSGVDCLVDFLKGWWKFTLGRYQA